MIYKYLILIGFLLVSNLTFSQSYPLENLQKSTYISAESNYRSYGTNDITGTGFGIELSQDLKKWLGLGINLSYWDNERIDWDFFNEVTGERIIKPTSITEFKISPFAQILPVNTRYFDFIIRAGGRLGYYHQVFHVGGYSYDSSSSSFSSSFNDIGYKGINLGYELGFELRFQISRFILAPSVLFANDLEANSYSALNFKIGYQLD